MDLYFQFDFNKTVIERDVYTILDFLSDIGGVMKMFIIIFRVLLAAINYRYPEVFVASRLYKISQPSDKNFDKKDKKRPHAEQSSFFKPSGFITRQCLSYYMPGRLNICCKLSREQKGILKA